MRFSAALECAACVCFFFSENCEFGKKSAQNLWDCEKDSEIVWHMVKPWLRGLPWAASLVFHFLISYTTSNGTFNK